MRWNEEQAKSPGFLSQFGGNVLVCRFSAYAIFRSMCMCNVKCFMKVFCISILRARIYYVYKIGMLFGTRQCGGLFFIVMDCQHLNIIMIKQIANDHCRYIFAIRIYVTGITQQQFIGNKSKKGASSYGLCSNLQLHLFRNV